MAAARYVALNPIRAKLVARAEDWRWSSDSARLIRRDDGVIVTALERCGGGFAADRQRTRSGAARRAS